MKKNNDIHGTVLSEKKLFGDERTLVTLRKDRYFYYVYVGKELYKRTPNELFTVQVFNAI